MGGFTDIATKACIDTAVIASFAVTYLETAEFVAGYGGHGAIKPTIHATASAEKRLITNWAIQGAIRWGARVANTGGESSWFVRFTATARYVVTVRRSSGYR
ncbi:hypothetical protein D6833_11035 [Candidatus Parcubacteria bacterium]|nr:MAG: hypothetical protein D6833_11035 [Candidatus Parcubacteria bacterium]